MRLNAKTEQFDMFEKEFGLTIPDDVKNHFMNIENLNSEMSYVFMKKRFVKGVQVEASLNYFIPFFENKQIERITAYKLFKELQEDFLGYLPFASDDGDAFFLVSLNKETYGEIRFYSLEEPMDTDSEKLASSFSRFWDSLIIKPRVKYE